VGLERSKQRLLVTIGKVVAQSKSVSHMGSKMVQKIAGVLVPEKMSRATATQSIRKCKTRIEKIGKSCLDTEPTAWGLDEQVWNLRWTGEETMKKGIPISKRAGFESVEDLSRTAVEFFSKAYQDLPPLLRLSTTLDGELFVRCTQCARTPPHHPFSYAGVPKSS